MTTFLEGLEMEERMHAHVEEILSQYPWNKYYPQTKFVEFHSSQGFKIEPSRDLTLDFHGIDITLHLDNHKRLKVQVKCGTKENFDCWGKDRRSLVLGRLNDITMMTTMVTPIRFCDLLLTGYETEEGSGRLGPWALITWPQLLLRAHHNAIELKDNENGEDGTVFAWATSQELQRCKVIFGECYDFTRFA
jgi:hypothetical protein